jgi:hypothetical protein
MVFRSSIITFTVLIACSSFLGGCSSSEIDDAIDDIDTIANGPDPKPIDQSIVGVNAFFNQPQFGSIDTQFSEIKNTLGLSFVRVLFAWTDGVQPTPNSPLNFSFFDDIATSIPAGVSALVVLTDMPSWMDNSANWVEGDPYRTIVEKWFIPVANRYSSNGRINAYQIWNEPNNPGFADNATLGFVANPDAYLDLLARAFTGMKAVNPNKLIVSAATTAIAQNNPETLNYNKELIASGISNTIDVYGLHIYGKQFENYEKGGGIFDTFEDLDRPIWVTESNAQGVNSQKNYVEQLWPYVRENIPQIERFYIYRMYDTTPAESTYALHGVTPGLELSDLYILLRDS